MASYKGSKEAFSRQKALENERLRMLEDFEAERKKISESNKIDVGPSRFVSAQLDVESNLKKDTIGLVELEQFKQIRKSLEKKEKEKTSVEKRKASVKKNKLSFNDDIEESDEEPIQWSAKKQKVRKDPAANTVFLPDKNREEEEESERQKLRLRWIKEQEKIKAESIEITFSYWDGHGHRASIACLKGDSIDRFLSKAREKFPQIRGMGTDKLMFVKEDLIIPHHYTFYDFILNKARGKSGPLFDFGVSDDIRLINDASKETTESHAAKIVERSWFERNRHVFPVNRWEVYDPTKDYGKYSIKDRQKMI